MTLSSPTLYDHRGRALPVLRRRRAMAAVPGLTSGSLITSAPYRGAGYTDQASVGWTAAPVSSASETLAGRSTLAARAWDLYRNSGVIHGAAGKRVAQTVGSGFRLRALPDADALGVDLEEAALFGRQIEREWRRFTASADIRGMVDFGGLAGVAWLSRFISGESLWVVRWRPERRARYATCLQEVDPERLGNPNDQADTDFLRQGVQLDPDTGTPVGYHIRDRHPADYVATAERWHWTYLPREDETGRPVVIHGFSADKPEQLRGVSALAPILLAMQKVEQFSDAEIGAATLNALLTVFLRSDLDAGAIAESMGLVETDGNGLSRAMDTILSHREAAYGNDGLRIMGNRVTELLPTDVVDIRDTTRETSAFGDFKKAFLRDVAAALGLSYPQLAEDWEAVNFSSARLALSETWRLVTQDRAGMIYDTVSPVYRAFMGEAFERGYLTEPDGWPLFEDAPDAYLSAQWIGPPRGYVDPYKERQADQIGYEMGLVSAGELAAEQGRDLEDVFAANARERALAQRYGQPLASTETILSGAPARDDD